MWSGINTSTQTFILPSHSKFGISLHLWTMWYWCPIWLVLSLPLFCDNVTANLTLGFCCELLFNEDWIEQIQKLGQLIKTIIDVTNQYKYIHWIPLTNCYTHPTGWVNSNLSLLGTKQRRPTTQHSNNSNNCSDGALISNWTHRYYAHTTLNMNLSKKRKYTKAFNI